MFFFSFWKTIIFNGTIAIIYLLISEHRLIYFSWKSLSNRVIVQEIKYDKKNKVKPTVKDKITKFNYILRESTVEAVENQNLYR